MAQNNRGSPKPRIATLGDLRNDNNNDARGTDKGQNFYTGGGSSGLEVEGPSKNSNLPKNPNELVSSLFDSARKQGARTTEDYEREKKESNKGDKYFQGNAYKLGSSTTQSSQHFRTPTQPTPSPPPLITVSFWQNGFTVDNGELRGYDDPKNQSFLQDINNGIAPEELVRASGSRSDIEIRLENKHDQPYTPPAVVKPKIVPFSGTGFTLGSSDTSPPVNNNNNNPTSQNNNNTHKTSTSSTQPSSDNNEQTTRIQIQFHDGTKIAQQFPVSTSVFQLRQFVESQKPTGREFQLMITYPRKVLDDDSLTLLEAKLLNSLIVQKLI